MFLNGGQEPDSWRGPTTWAAWSTKTDDRNKVRENIEACAQQWANTSTCC